MATQITADLPTLDFPREADYPTQEDWAAFSAAAEQNFGILGNGWSTQMQLWKTEANAMSTELNTNATIAQGLADYQGDWISQGYTLGQTVSVSGIYYVCKLTHVTGQNPTDISSLYWNLALGNWSLKIDTNMSGYISKTTPVDADLIPLSDSVSSFGIKKLSFANLKATLFNGAISLTQNGYIKFPSVMGGLIIQWGTSASVLTSNIGIYTYAVPLPITFPNNAFCAVASHAGTNSALSSGVSINGYTNTTVTISLQNARSDQSVSARYIIIGN